MILRIKALRIPLLTVIELAKSVWRAGFEVHRGG
jgi:hypothetical protein